MREFHARQRSRLAFAFGVTGALLVTACSVPDRNYDDSDAEGGRDSTVGGSSSTTSTTPDQAGASWGNGGTTGNTSTGEGGSPTSGGTASTDAGAAGTTSFVTGGHAGSDAAGQAGKAGDASRPANRNNRVAAVSGGLLMTSSNYRLVVTTGEAPAGNGVMRSTNFTLQCGFVGVSQ